MKMQISKTKIKFNSKRKTNPAVVEILALAMKRKEWLHVAKMLSSSTRKYSMLNLSDIDKETKEADTVMIIGKVLGSGNVSKKVRVCALNFSKSALDKLKKAKAEIVTIAEEIKKNPKCEGVKILR